MSIKLYLLLFLPFLAFSNNHDSPPGKSSYWTAPAFAENPHADRWDGMFYSFNKQTGHWENKPWFAPLKLDESSQFLSANDPVRFFITASKDSISIGEEVELTITAQFLDIHPMLMFQFDGSNEFTLKLLIPDGFVVTGGTYYDYIQGKVDRNNPTQRFTVKGFFEGEDDLCFNLIRGARNAGAESVYYKVARKCLNSKKALVESISEISNSPLIEYLESYVHLRNISKEGQLRTAAGCGTLIDLNFEGSDTGPNIGPAGWTKFSTIDTWSCGAVPPGWGIFIGEGLSNCIGKVVGFSRINEGVEAISKTEFFEANKEYRISLKQASGIINAPGFFRVTIGETTLNFPTISSSNVAFHEVSHSVIFSRAENKAITITHLSSSMNDSDISYFLLDDFKIMTDGTNPDAPTLSSLSNYVPTTLTATCSTGTVQWSDGIYGATRSINLAGTYSAVCKTSENCSSISGSKVLEQGCTAPPTPTFWAGSLKINENSTTALTVAYCGGIANFYSQGSSNPFYSSSSNQSVNVGPGTYYATCKVDGCTSTPTAALTIKTVGCDYDINIGSNATNTGLSVGDELQLWSSISGGEAGASYSYSWEKNAGATGANTNWHVIQNVKEADKGNYRLRAIQNGYTKACYSEPIYVNVSPCSFSGTLGYQQLSSSELWINVQTNKPCVGCNYRFYRNGAYVAHGQNNYIQVPNTAANRGNYHVEVTTPSNIGCTFSTNTINVDFPAQPNYQARINNLHCDYISGMVADYANPNVYQEASLVIKNATTNALIKRIELKPNSNYGGEWYYRIDFPELYKDGNTYKVAVQHVNNNYSHSAPAGDGKLLTCCTLNIVNVQVPETCEATDKTASAVFRFNNRNAAIPLNYKIARKVYLEGGAIQYEDITTEYVNVPASVANNQDVTIQALPTGDYRLELKQGNLSQTTNCIVYDYFTVDCNSLIGGCRAPMITVTPSDEIQEGLNITPILFADFLKNEGVASSPTANFGSAADFTGNNALGLKNMGGWENVTAEGWINANSAGPITVGEIGEGSKQRYLFSSDVSGTKISWKLSVGSNGFTLIEYKQNSNSKRVALARQMNLQGWHYISLVYRNNLATVYVDGAEVITATKTAKDAFYLSNEYQIEGPNTLGGQQNEGFHGYVDEVKIYSRSITQNEIIANMGIRNANNIVLPQSNLTGYYPFPANNTFANQKNPGDTSNEVRGILNIYPVANNPKLSEIFKTADLDWYYNGTLVAENALRYIMPKEQIRVGDYTYIVKWTGKNGEVCETSKTVTIKPAQLSQLSGCFTVTPQQYSNTLMAVTNYAANNTIGIRTQVPGNISGESLVWQFDYLGDETYKIKIAANNKYLAEKSFWINETDNGEVQLVDADNNAAEQRWKIKILNSSSSTPTVRVSNNAGTRVLSSGEQVSRNVTLTTSGQPDSYARQNFKLTKTGCPTPPKPCVSDGKVMVERLNVSNTNAIDYLNLNRDKMEMFINRYRNNNQAVSYAPGSGRWDFNGYPTIASGSPSQSSQFVARLSGYVCPDQSKNYNFRLEGPRSRMYMSNNEDPRGKQLVINNDDGSGTTSWNIALTQGRSYYYEVITMDSYNGGNGSGNLADYQKLYVNDMSNPTQLNMFSSSPRDTKPKKERTDVEACGIMPPSPSASDDMPMLFAGDTLHAADFKVIIQSVAGANGTFSGNGFANMKYLMDTPIKVRFDGIRVNDYYELVGGEITTEYDKNWGNISDVDEVISDIYKEVKSVVDGAKTFLETAWDKVTSDAYKEFSDTFKEKLAEEYDSQTAAAYSAVLACAQTQIDIINQKKPLCDAIPPDAAACTAVTNAKNALEQCKAQFNTLETQRNTKLALALQIIKETLESLRNKTHSNASRNAAAALAGVVPVFSSTTIPEPEEPMYEQRTIDFNDFDPSFKNNIEKYYKEEALYNKNLVSKYYGQLYFNDPAKHKAIAESVVAKNGAKISKYILDKIGSDNTLTASEKTILISELSELFSEQIFEEILVKDIYKKL